MIIKSNFKDYYDSFAHNKHTPYSADDLTYLRYSKVVEDVPKGVQEVFYKALPKDIPYDRTPWVVVGFCGIAYAIYKLQMPRVTDNYDEKPTYRYCTNREMLKGVKLVSHYLDLKGVRNFSDWHVIDVSDEIFKEIGAPIFSVSVRGYHMDIFDFTTNPKLAGLGFERIREPYTAYQDLNKFLSTNMTSVLPMPEFSDTVKIEAHGFDKKMSFRKRKV